MATTKTISITASLDDTYCNSGSQYETSAMVLFGKLSSTAIRAFLRFKVPLPPGVTITAAKITFTSKPGIYGTGDFTTNVKVTDEDSAADFSSNPWARSMMAGSVAWVIDTYYADGVEFESPELKTIVQAWIDRAAYAKDNYIGIRIDEGDAGSGENRVFYSQDEGSGKQAVLTISYQSEYEVQVEGILDELVTQLKTLDALGSRVYKHSFDKLSAYPACLILLQRDRVTPAAALQWHALNCAILVFEGTEATKSATDLITAAGLIADKLDTIKENAPSWTSCLIDGDILYGFVELEKKTFYVAIITVTVKKSW